MGRQLVIGDIHNAYRALKQALERANITPDDELIFLGDYLDGWSEARETMELVFDLQKTNKCTFVKGNHDEWVLDWLQSDSPSYDWLVHGGSQTRSSFVKWFNEDSTARERVTEFLEKCVNYHVDDNNKLFIHAGFIDTRGVGYCDVHTEYVYYWDRSLYKNTRDATVPPKRLSVYNQVYIGHTPILWDTQDDKPWNKFNLWNIDTGAAYHGRVTVMNVNDNTEYYQSDPVRSLYPNERGRNQY